MTPPDAVIVGAGLAGLACAHHLHQNGLRVKVFDTADAVGGRLRTDEVDGFLLDRGFQTILTSYPEAAALLDFDSLDVQAFFPGALVWTGTEFSRIADPLREPRAAWATLTAPIGGLADKLRMLRLRRSVTAGPPDRLWSRPEISTRDALTDRYGFSSSMREGFLRPFLGGVLLDPHLATSSRAFEFYFRMFALGRSVIPARGMQRIPEQLAEKLPAGCIRLDTRVARARPHAVTLETGEVVDAPAVVVAVEGPELTYVAEGIEAPDSRSTCCLYFAADEPPHEDPILVLNGTGEGPVNHLAVMSAVSSQLAPPGRHLISASVLGNPAITDDRLVEAVRMQLRGWYGPTVDTWKLIKLYRVLHALPTQNPPALSPARRPARLASGLFICGDHRTNASINGALESGRYAAEAVLQSAS